MRKHKEKVNKINTANIYKRKSVYIHTKCILCITYIILCIIYMRNFKLSTYRITKLKLIFFLKLFL